MENSSIVIFKTADGSPSIDVRLENETVWLTQHQMAELFQKDRTVIGRHINNIFKEGELDKEVVCAKFAHTTRHGAILGKSQTQEIVLYNLDVIISVGYRVKSVIGTQFRIWANKLIKDYLVKGYVINNRIAAQKYEELSQLVRLLGRTVRSQIELTADENELLRATYEHAMEAITTLKDKFGGSELFAREKDSKFNSSIGQIYQTWVGRDLYPSVKTILTIKPDGHTLAAGHCGHRLSRSSGSVCRGQYARACHRHACCPRLCFCRIAIGTEVLPRSGI